MHRTLTPTLPFQFCQRCFQLKNWPSSPSWLRCSRTLCRVHCLVSQRHPGDDTRTNTHRCIQLCHTKTVNMQINLIFRSCMCWDPKSELVSSKIYMRSCCWSREPLKQLLVKCLNSRAPDQEQNRWLFLREIPAAADKTRLGQSQPDIVQMT
jgi:hypothetical protein